MPPRTRGSKTTKNLKENLGVVNKTKLKVASRTTKPPRKALADITNSASDDNTSVEVLKKVSGKVNPKPKQTATEPENEKARPRRNRRLPSRFVENEVLTNLSNSKENVIASSTPTTKSGTTKIPVVVISPLKTPKRSLETSLVNSRPRRICRLPSKLEECSVSPNKFIPVQPCNASTPIVQNKDAKVTVKSKPKLVQKKVNDLFNNTAKSRSHKDVSISENDKETNEISSKKQGPIKQTSDTNNNAKQLRSTRAKKAEAKVILKNKKTTPVKSPTKSNKIFVKNTSFRIFDDKKEKENKDKLDVYEFTFDPNEEPPPQKKKRKRVTKKKPTQPKSVVFKNNYDKNVSKALMSLKNAVSIKTQEKPAIHIPAVKRTEQSNKTAQITNDKQNAPSTTGTTLSNVTVQPTKNIQNSTTKGEDINYASIRVEDIAADFEQTIHDNHDINYSPVNSPCRPKTPTNVLANTRCQTPIIDNNDPLNLREELSFFDEQPVASSSMNMSVKHPHASPWRAEFSNLPIKWQVNTYVKPNMTPALESSFINFEGNKKKHVYTNLVPEQNESLPQIVDNETSKLKQTSIISFIKEVIERSAKKKKRGRSDTPTKANSIFEDISNVSIQTAAQTPKHTDATSYQSSSIENTSNNSKNSSRGKENSRENRKRKNNSPLKTTPAKLACKEKNKDHTLFGFDDSENLDLENVSPLKQIDRGRVQGLRPRARAVLQELNAQSGPTRAVLPVAAKTKLTSSDAVNKVYEEMKSATDAPVFPEKDTVNNEVPETTINNDLYDDSQSVHLFEDIEVVHHLKPSRKSYGKSKKVTFRQPSLSDSDTQQTVAEHAVSSDEDDRNDFTFEIPTVKVKKPSKKKKSKKQLSKKEEKELEEWAAGFNSMCEDIEEVGLVVE